MGGGMGEEEVERRGETRIEANYEIKNPQLDN